MNPNRLAEFNQLIARVRNNDHSLTTLSLSHFGLTDQDIIIITNALANNNNVTELDVSRNHIGVVGARALALNQTLTSLNVSSNHIGNAGARALAHNKTLTTLNVFDNQIGDAGARALARNQTLTTLNVHWNNIGDAGARALASNQTLTSLDVNGNQIGDAGTRALGSNLSLNNLEIFLNNFGDAGAEALSTRQRFKEIHEKVSDYLLSHTVELLYNHTVERNLSDSDELPSVDLSREEIELFLSQDAKRAQSLKLIKSRLIDYFKQNGGMNDGILFRLENNNKNSPKNLQHLAFNKAVATIFSNFVNELKERLAQQVETPSKTISPLSGSTVENNISISSQIS